MRLFRGLQASLLLRRLSRQLDRLNESWETHNQLLARLADRFAPEIPTEAPARASVDFLNQEEADQVLRYVERSIRDTGRHPTDEEILVYLAEEATRAQHGGVDA